MVIVSRVSGHLNTDSIRKVRNIRKISKINGSTAYLQRTENLNNINQNLH